MKCHVLAALMMRVGFIVLSLAICGSCAWIVAQAGSPTLLAVRNSLFDRAERYRNLSALFRPHPRDKTGEHRALMQAAISRNAEQACSLIRTHIQTTSDNVAKYASGVIGSR